MSSSQFDPKQSIDVPAFLESGLDQSFGAFCQAFIGIGRLAPDQVADLIRELPEEQAQQVAAGLQQIGLSAENLSPLLRQIAGYADKKEAARRPAGREFTNIDLSKVVGFQKQSKLDYDARVRGKSREQVLRDYQHETSQEDIDRIVRADLAHARSIELLSSLLPNPDQLFILNTLEPDRIRELLEQNQLAIAIGGDDTCKDLAQYIEDSFLMVVNSNPGPGGSVGGLCYFSARDLAQMFMRLESGKFLVEEWTRLEASIEKGGNGTGEIIHAPPTCSEMGTLDYVGRYPFRGTFKIEGPNGLSGSIKGTGFTVATGAGRGGLFGSANKYKFPLPRMWKRTEPRAEFVVREPFGEFKTGDILTGILGPEDTLVITCSSNRKPIFDCDSVWYVDFQRGDRAEIRLSDKRLKVISNQTGF